MGAKKKAGFSAYAAAPLMIILGFTVASLVFIFVLKEPSPVPVFIIFAVIQAGCMTLYALLPDKAKNRARMVSMFLIGTCLMVVVGVLSRNNVQIEGFFFYLFAGSAGGVIVHFAMAKLLGPIFFGRNWCSWGCWTAMVLDLLPYKGDTTRKTGALSKFRYLYFGLALIIPAVLYFGMNFTIIQTDAAALERGMGSMREFVWFLTGNALYYVIGISLAIALKDNRAFCKYVCPVSVFLKTADRFTFLRIKGDRDACTSCDACVRKCPMSINIPEYIKAGRRVTSTECIMCMNCVAACPQTLLHTSAGVDFLGRKQEGTAREPVAQEVGTGA